MTDRTAAPAFALPEAPRASRRAFLAGVIALHAAAGVVLSQCRADPPATPRAMKTFDVAIVSEPVVTPPEPQPLPTPKAPLPPNAPWVLLPEVMVAIAPPPPITVAPTPPEPAPAPPSPVVTAAAPSPAPPAPPAPAAPPAPPPAPKRVSPDALDYLVPPPDDFPPLSRRLHETGKVVLRVVFDVEGNPRLVALARSSGYTRLDEQAVTSMRKARIRPCKENGVPIECELVAAMVYQLED